MMGCSPISNKCVSEDVGLRKEIMSKAHHSRYTVYPESTKIYKDKKRMKLEFSTDFHPQMDSQSKWTNQILMDMFWLAYGTPKVVGFNTYL
jgi:hypothetical protein